MFFSRKVYPSVKNGEIVVLHTIFQTPTIIVKGCQQSGSYIVSMWKSVLSRIPKNIPIKNILVLGLGGGDVIKLLQKKYSDTSITVIEWDETMVEIFYALNTNLDMQKINIQTQDAFQVIKDDIGVFDIIIVDLFNGKNPPEKITENGVQLLLESHLSSSGYLFVNFYSHKDYAPSFEDVFNAQEIFVYRANTIGLFRKKN